MNARQCDECGTFAASPAETRFRDYPFERALPDEWIRVLVIDNKSGGANERSNRLDAEFCSFRCASAALAKEGAKRG